jgi:hypothetical protein
VVELSLVPDSGSGDPIITMLTEAVVDRSPKGIAAAVHRLISRRTTVSRLSATLPRSWA